MSRELAPLFATPFGMRSPTVAALIAASLLAVPLVQAQEPPQPETVIAADEPACPPGATLEDEDPTVRALAPELRDRFLVTGCPPRGCAGDSPNQARLNLRKNRVDAPTESEIDPSITLEAMMAPSKDDRERWKPDVGARVVGFVRNVWRGGIESANCRTEDIPRRDTHIDLFLSDDPDVPRTRRIVTEVTPRFRALAASRGLDWSTEGLKEQLEGRWVEITGWTFFDIDHCNETHNTIESGCWGSGRIWRQSGWEIHPITSFRVLPGPPDAARAKPEREAAR